MLRLRSVTPPVLALGALLVMVACEIRVGAPEPPSSGAGATDDTSGGTGATRPVGSSTGRGGDPTQTEAVVTNSSGTGGSAAGGDDGTGGAGGDAIYHCQTNGQCDIQDDCVCPDCSNHLFCANPANCKDDGTCKPFLEGCICADCASLDICSP